MEGVEQNPAVGRPGFFEKIQTIAGRDEEAGFVAVDGLDETFHVALQPVRGTLFHAGRGVSFGFRCFCALAHDEADDDAGAEPCGEIHVAFDAPHGCRAHASVRIREAQPVLAERAPRADCRDFEPVLFLEYQQLIRVNVPGIAHVDFHAVQPVRRGKCEGFFKRAFERERAEFCVGGGDRGCEFHLFLSTD